MAIRQGKYRERATNPRKRMLIDGALLNIGTQSISRLLAYDRRD